MNNKSKCKSCGVEYVNHLGIQGTCEALQTCLRTLEQIGSISPNKRASVNARATLLFIQTQLGVVKMPKKNKVK